EDQLQADAISQHGGYRFHVFVPDTQHEPSKALEAIKDLDRRGAQIIIGPQTSSEVAMIKPYADAHNILVISQGSTASSLAIPGDNIFSLCPDDLLEAEAIVALMLHDGIINIVPLWRNDAGNNGLHDSVKAQIEARTGIKPDAFALSTYDALFVIQRALEDVGDLKDFAAFKAAFVSEADAYVGITGSMALNSAGDRANGDFDFWAVRNDTWVRI